MNLCDGWVYNSSGSLLQERMMVVHEKYLKAGNPETAIEELRNLLEEGCQNIRRRLAENPGTPEDVLFRLAQDQDSEVRIAVAENPLTPRIIQEQLIFDEDVQVRFAVSGLYSFPVDLLQRMAEDDENPYVRDHASRTLEGIFLEQALAELGFVPKPGETDKLGELLVEAGILQPDSIFELLRIANERQVPLGRTIVGTRLLPRSIIVTTLSAQLKIRSGELTHEEAIRDIKRVWEAYKREETEC